MKKITPITETYYPLEQTQHEKNEIFRNKINEIIEELNNRCGSETIKKSSSSVQIAHNLNKESQDGKN